MVHKSMFMSLVVTAVVVQAANDWSTKCKGTCSYETEGTKGRAFASFAIDGPSKLVSDITSAASWELLDCPSDWSSGPRQVRLVCTADDPTAEGCDDLLEDGAVNTVVRLPEECGTGPFARVATWGVADDQSIPIGSQAEQKLRRRKRADLPQVMSATLDWKLREIPSDRGTLSLDVQASNSDLANKRIVAVRSLKDALYGKNGRRMIKKRASKRQFGFIDDIVDGAQDAVDTVVDVVDDTVDVVDETVTDVTEDVVDTVEDVAGDVVEGAQDVVEGAEDVVEDVVDTVADANNVDVVENGSFDTIKIKDNFSILDTSLSCNVGLVGGDLSLKISADVDVEANIGYAFIMKGTIVPPAVNDFGIAAAMSGRAKANILIDAFLNGDIDTGLIKLIDVGIPGLSIPGILNLGPQLALKAQGIAQLDVSTSMSIPVTWDFPLLDMVVPPERGPSTGDATESQSVADFKLNLSPGTLDASLQAKIVPSLEFGIDAIGGFATAELFLSAAADGTMKLEAEIFEDFSMEGCNTLSVGIDVKAGARGQFLTFFNEQLSIPIFNKRAEIFKKCFAPDEGPATAIEDNGDGTFTNALGDLVNEKGELIDENGQVIPDADAETPGAQAPGPIVDEAGNEIPEQDVIFDNGDGTFEDAFGNPTNDKGQFVDAKGELLSSELELEGLVDDDGQPIPPEEVIVENPDGTLSDASGNIVNENGQVVDENGDLVGSEFEPILDEAGNPIPEDQIVIENEDGTFSDFNGNPVDEFGGIIEFDAEGNVIDVPLQPAQDLSATEQTEDPAPITEDPPFTIKTPDEVKQIALDLVNGVAPAPPAPPAEVPPPPPVEAEVPPPAEAEVPPPPVEAEVPLEVSPPVVRQRRNVMNISKPLFRRDFGKRALGCTTSVTSPDQLTPFF